MSFIYFMWCVASSYFVGYHSADMPTPLAFLSIVGIILFNVFLAALMVLA